MSTSTAPTADLRPILLTGFEPFDGADVNESWEAVRLAGAMLRREPDPGSETLAGSGADSPMGASAEAPRLDVRTLLLPVEFGAAGDLLARAITDLRPCLVVAVGLAAGRTRVTPERVAINVRDARIPDAADAQPVDEPVMPGGPVGRLSTLPIKAMTAAIEAAGVPAAVSQTAGTYVCNDVFYRVLSELEGTGVRGGFVHVPGRHAVSIEDSARALVAGVRAALSTEADERLSGGTEF